MLDMQMPENEWMRARRIVLKNGEEIESLDNMQREDNFLFVYGQYKGDSELCDVYNLDAVAEIHGLEFPEEDLMNEER